MTPAPDLGGATAEALAGLAGIDPGWSRTVTAPDADGVPASWHLLDNGVEPTLGTMLCVHGNPTWSYLWRRFLATAPAGWRVIAVDQLGMGFSERRDAPPHRFQDRVDDLCSLTDALGLTGPVVIVGHDWGGPIVAGWALRHRDQLAGLVLANTAVHQPASSAPPALIRLARSPALLRAVCVDTPIFVHGAAALSRPALPRPVRRALAAPYAQAGRRTAIGQFVADIPLEPDHPSQAALAAVAEGLPQLADVPVLLLRGARDPVFTEAHLRDLRARLPHADVQRYEGASHLVTEDVPEAVEHVWTWVRSRVTARTPVQPRAAPVERVETNHPQQSPWAALTAGAGDQAVAVVEVDSGRRISFAELEQQVVDLAAGLRAAGVQPGHRVALLVPPGIELTTAVYACWRAGAIIVVADAGLGVRSMGRALRGAGPDQVIGIARGLAAARALRIPGQRIGSGQLPAAVTTALGCRYTMADLIALGRSQPTAAVQDAAGQPAAGEDAECAVLFTSGATGPAKGVVYRLSQVRDQLELIKTGYGLGADDRLVAAFAPFALYGPALGIGAAVPDMDVTAPGSLTAAALADAVLALDATAVFASPSALRNVVATQPELHAEQRAALGRVRLALSAGAPVPLSLLREVQQLLPNAVVHTPYGMTEAMPVTDITLQQREAACGGNGVCVGWPLPGVSVAISPLPPDNPDEPTPDELSTEAGVTGEICVAAAHVKDHYDQLWVTNQASSRIAGWHHTGDVGHLDDQGRLWIEGRLLHVIDGAGGPATPVGVEQRVEALDGVRAAAAVGVGPAGTQQLVLVIEPATASRRPVSRWPLPRRQGPVLAGDALTHAVRSVAGAPVAAVLVAGQLPVDIRHQSKVDRVRVARWAESVLAGGRPERL